MKKLTFHPERFFHILKKIEMFFPIVSISQLQPVLQYIMFSFLNNGDIRNTIRTLTGFSGLSSSDGDKIKYSLLNHATAMRMNLAKGLPIFTNIRQSEAEIETRDINSITSARVPSAAASFARASAVLSASAAFTPDDLHYDNAALAVIMAKELAFLNRTIQLISLIASRYQQEQEDANWGRSEDHHLSDGSDDYNDDNDDNDEYDEEAMTPIRGLRRSESHLSSSSSHHDNDDDRRHTSSDANSLVTTFLVGSGQLQKKFINLCQLAGTSIVLVNAMTTTMDNPRSEANFEKQRNAENLVLSDIYLEFEKYDAEHRDPVVWAFLELRDISVSAWRMISMLAFCNLIRLAEGTDFTSIYRSPDHAIFSQGRDYVRQEEEEVPATTETATATATMEFDDDSSSSICGW
jgi:hypothetical protein